jgi:ABC-type amino acid transport system permease subunit
MAAELPQKEISVQEIKKYQNSYKKTVVDLDPLSLKSTLIQLWKKETEDILSMRTSWSKIFKCLVIFIFAFEVMLTIAVGFDILKFEDEWFLRIMLSGGIAQILGMPILVTKFLFSNIQRSEVKDLISNSTSD